MTPYPRIAWTTLDNSLVEQAVNGLVPLDELFDRMGHRSYKALRRRFVTFGRPDEETRHRRMMMFGSTALRRAIVAALP